MRGLFALTVAVAGCHFAPDFGPKDAPNNDTIMIDVETFHDAPIDGPGGARRKPITIDHNMVQADLNNFPVWIDISGSDIAGGAQPDGHDIFFTNATGTPLDYEIESWASPRLRAWVRIPALSSNNDTKIYVQYGVLANATAPNPVGVFNASFVAVWHLADPLTDTTIADATGTHAGTATGLTAANHVNGKLGTAVNFPGQSTTQIAFTNPLMGNTPHTISAWVNLNTVNHTSAVVTVGTNATAQARFLYAQYAGANNIGLGVYNDDWQPSVNVEAAGWVLLHWTHEGNNKKSHIFRDGVEQGTVHTFANAPNTTGTTGLIGMAPEPTFGSPNAMDGMLDEVRIATVMRNKDWCETEFLNQSAPSTFYTVGAEEPAP